GRSLAGRAHPRRRIGIFALAIGAARLPEPVLVRRWPAAGLANRRLVFGSALGADALVEKGVEQRLAAFAGPAVLRRRLPHAPGAVDTHSITLRFSNFCYTIRGLTQQPGSFPTCSWATTPTALPTTSLKKPWKSSPSWATGAWASPLTIMP